MTRSRILTGLAIAGVVWPLFVARGSEVAFPITIVLVVATILRFGPRPLGNVLLAILALGIGIALFLPTISASRETGRRLRCVENLDRIGMALKAYRAERGSYPPVDSSGSKDRPSHSWRVLILPYLGPEEEGLYGKYDLKKPWNGPENAGLADQAPHVFLCPSECSIDRESNYLALTGPDTAWDRNVAGDGKTRSMAASSILVVEVTHPGIGWTEPRDSTLDDNSVNGNDPSKAGIGSSHASGSHVLFADGSVRFIRNENLDIVRAKCLTANGKKNIDWEAVDAPIINLKGFHWFLELAIVFAPVTLWLMAAILLFVLAWRGGRKQCSSLHRSHTG